MNILVLGGCGFIGSYVVRKLLESGGGVTCVDNFSKYGYIEHNFYGDKKFKLVKKDVRELAASEYKGYDVVLCFAALIGGIKYFHKIPYRISKENTEILIKTVDSILGASPQTILYYFSSSMVYERMSRPVTEEDALTQPVPITNYGMQKLFGEFIVRGASQEYGLKYVIVRPFNAVGAGELPEVNSKGEVDFGMAHVIPDFVYKSLVKQSPFEILGDGSQVRTFTHAKDIADAVQLMINRKVVNDDFNICGNNTYSVGDLAKLIWNRINKDQKFPGFNHLSAPMDDVKFRVGVSDKAKKILGWTPKFDINYVIDDTTGYVSSNLNQLTGKRT